MYIKVFVMKYSFCYEILAVLLVSYLLNSYIIYVVHNGVRGGAINFKSGSFFVGELLGSDSVCIF